MASTRKEPLEVVLDRLCKSQETPSQTPLYYLSGLVAEEAERVREAWPAIPVDQRQELTSWLRKMAEADFTLNFGAVFRVAMDDDDDEVRKTAIEGLWEDQDVRLVPRLAELLRNDESARVRAAAAKSLGRFVLLGELGKIRPEPRRVAYQALMEAHQAWDEDVEVRRRALESLACVGNETVIASIREAYTSPSEKVRVSAVFAMGRSADNRWEQEVQAQLFSTNPEMRYEAARACGELQLSEAVWMLEELAEDTDPEVQEAAIWALGQTGGERAREILEYYCQATDEALRSAAEAAVEEFEFLHGDLEDIFADLAEKPYL
ncbi:MAG: HEAT repeat domain-containing protein [Anaerolineae bacterium]